MVLDNGLLLRKDKSCYTLKLLQAVLAHIAVRMQSALEDSNGLRRLRRKSDPYILDHKS